MYLYVCTFELQGAVPIAALLALCTFMEFLNFDGECLPTTNLKKKMMYYAIIYFVLGLL